MHISSVATGATRWRPVSTNWQEVCPQAMRGVADHHASRGAFEWLHTNEILKLCCIYVLLCSIYFLQPYYIRR
jgi:hypothetical protein